MLQNRIVQSAVFAATVAIGATTAPAGFIQFVPGPTWLPGTEGYRGQFSQVLPQVNDSGLIIANLFHYTATPTLLGNRAIRWNAPGGTFELGLLGTDSAGKAVTRVRDLNNAGESVGEADKFVAGVNKGRRAVRWDASGQVLELPNLGTNPTGGASSIALRVNELGVSIGLAEKWDGNGETQGLRAVRWNAAGTVATEFALAWTTPGRTDNSAGNVINNHNVAAGTQSKYNAAGNYLGDAAVRWDAAGNVVELGRLDANPGDFAGSTPYAINDAGTVVGNVGIVGQGGRPVRWDANSTDATALEVLGTSSSGETNGFAAEINEAGVIVGQVTKYTPAGVDRGPRAVRWDAGSTVVQELDVLGTFNGNGHTYSSAADINNANFTVGYARAYEVGGDFDFEHAVYWRPDGSVVDLNSLIDPNSGWSLNFANSISDTGWIAGEGLFDPDGAGSIQPYVRGFVMRVPEAAVPEPTGFVLTMATMAGLSLRRRRSRANRAHA